MFVYICICIILASNCFTSIIHNGNTKWLTINLYTSNISQQTYTSHMEELNYLHISFQPPHSSIPLRSLCLNTVLNVCLEATVWSGVYIVCFVPNEVYDHHYEHQVSNEWIIIYDNEGKEYFRYESLLFILFIFSAWSCFQHTYASISPYFTRKRIWHKWCFRKI